uniref:Uncharacterized protein n=1 Tax=Tanacetum cinerariifolium TaxID=118510 RepID=A0A699JGV9_TANCI|nr:hypothetical protein [Tanacetum cinerariifolium]
MAFVSTPSTSNNDDVSTVSAVSTTSSQVSTTNLSDATVYAFLANQPNGPHLVHEYLEQIHEDDLKEMDLKWQLAVLSMRAKRFFQKTCKKIAINGKCQGTRNQETTRRIVNVEDTSSKAMVVINGAGFEWSYMGDDEAPTNMAFMYFLDSETRRFSPPRIDLSYTGLLEFTEPSVQSYRVKPIEVVTQTSSVKISEPIKENNGAPIIED